MLFHIVYDGLAGFDGSDVGGFDFLATKDGVNTPADGAGQGIVEHDVNLAQFGLGVDVAPLNQFTLQDTLKILDGDTSIGIGIVGDDGQTVVG